MKLQVNGIDVHGNPLRGQEGKKISKKALLQYSQDEHGWAPDLLRFEKGIYCAFIQSGITRGDEIEYTTNFGVKLLTTGNRRTLGSFLGFRKCTPDGKLTFIDAPYHVYDNNIQYRRYVKEVKSS